ncbi:TetR/AcrR family transcriptional regulator [Hydrogenophaga sp. PAMC20947]|uniref:TetR/AcrR family transcriptional regulator n=1 Tax=Hydrogenophaga sp. PAMC20947 TaxID=2565558 RepID=UPI00109DB2A8|nr:TetR/AcrR family transcriptional regulator [Hydrogenophaga sp. PAMC20947]QCB47211.1 TetR/AcrR family transcriptional regulator [Hydrogenophaga sp. PAMC20947]
MPSATTFKQPTEVRQTSLIKAALALAGERSPADVTTAQLAHAIGVTQGAVFRHFESKEAIWLAVVEDTSERLLAHLSAAVTPHTDDGLRALEAVFTAHVAFVIEHPGMPRLVFQELQQPQDTPLKMRVRCLLQAYRVLLLEQLQRAQDQGQLAAGTDLPAAAVFFMGSIQGLVMQALVSGDVASMRTQAPSVFRLLRAGLSA